jgi:hypothetical protein
LYYKSTAAKGWKVAIFGFQKRGCDQERASSPRIGERDDRKVVYSEFVQVEKIQ